MVRARDRLVFPTILRQLCQFLFAKRIMPKNLANFRFKCNFEGRFHSSSGELQTGGGDQQRDSSL